ncbi:hypothetical protein KKE26_12520, partial [bacterium]|nr:hypothetical protein [bacterium]
PADEWDRLHHYCIYQEDFLENILALSIGYIYEIWHDKTRFHEILNSVLNLVENVLDRNVSFIPDVIKELPAVVREDIWIAVYNSIYDSYAAEKASKLAYELSITIRNKFKHIFKTERDEGIIKMRVAGASFEAAGQEYGLSRERIRQIERKMLRRFNHFLSRTKPHYILQTFTQNNILLSVDDIQGHLGELSGIFIYFLKQCNSKAVLCSNELNGFIIGDSSWYIQLIEYIDTLPDMFEASDLELYVSSFMAESKIKVDSNLVYKLILVKYNSTGSFFSKKKLNKANIYMAVLKKYYPNGIKLFDDFEMMRFRNYAKDLFGNVELPENDRTICARIAELTVLCGRGKYILPDQIRLDEELLNNIHQFITDSDRNIIMFSELFERFKSELIDKTSINNRFYLQGVLRYKYENKFFFTKDTLIKDINSEQGITLSIAIEAFIKEQGRIVTKDEIREEFS